MLSAALAEEAVPPEDAYLEVATVVMPRKPFEQEMVLLKINGFYLGPIALEKLQQPEIADFGWMNLGRDRWWDEMVGGRKLRRLERVVALFPKKPGRLGVGAFTHRLTLLGKDGKRFIHTIASAPIAIDVARKPQNLAWWFPAQSVAVTDSWDRAAGQACFRRRRHPHYHAASGRRGNRDAAPCPKDAGKRPHCLRRPRGANCGADAAGAHSPGDLALDCPHPLARHGTAGDRKDRVVRYPRGGAQDDRVRAAARHTWLRHCAAACRRARDRCRYCPACGYFRRIAARARGPASGLALQTVSAAIPVSSKPANAESKTRRRSRRCFRRVAGRTRPRTEQRCA